VNLVANNYDANKKQFPIFIAKLRLDLFRAAQNNQVRSTNTPGVFCSYSMKKFYARPTSIFPAIIVGCATTVPATALKAGSMPAEAAASTSAETAADSIHSTEWVPEVQVDANYKGSSLESLRPLSNTTLYMRRLELWRVSDIKDLTAIVPNVYIPDYGSRMTSSVYVRGLGSRIDQPAMGVYVDGVPLLNKNCYDFDWTDIRSVSVLRGPQNTLYGRNTMGGVIDLKTLSPLAYEGTRLSVEAGNGGLWRGRASLYRRASQSGGYAITAYGSHQDGFYENTATGSDIDWSNAAGLSARYDHVGTNDLRISNTAAGDWLNQGGYPYREVSSSGEMSPIAYNDRCAYRRWTFRDGFSVERSLADGRLTMVANTAYQWLDDRMNMDQDFTTAPIFTLEQAQQEHSLNEDFVIKSGPKAGRRWNHLTGINLWGRLLKMQAPVQFKQEGIDQLILSSVNRILANVMPGMALAFEEDAFDLESRFRTRSYGVAIYHNSTWTLGAWQLAAGARIDHEGQRFRYDCNSLVHLRVTPVMPRFVEFPTTLAGKEHQSFTEVAPTLSATLRRNGWTWHTSVARGYKSGGYNTQLFSDLLQQEMTSSMKSTMMGMMGGTKAAATTTTSSIKDQVAYKPEYSWNYETGIKYDLRNLHAEVTAFYIDCRDQQLTVFPKGVQTGRMMTNAGRTRSYGIESQFGFVLENFAFSASYGWTEATFRRYNSDTLSYRGKHIPYAPQHTLGLNADWFSHLGGAQSDWRLRLHADWRANGPVYWDDANDYRQDFYGILSASATLNWRKFGLTVWGKNLTDEDYQTFHFVSMQRHFVQMGKPVECGVKLTAEF
jgi:outer membrane receptor protein involved in Fe transport